MTRPLQAALLASAVVGVAAIPLVRRLRRQNGALLLRNKSRQAQAARSNLRHRREAAAKHAGTTTAAASY